MPFPGRRTRILLRNFKGVALVLLTLLSFLVALPVHPSAASASPGNPSSGPNGSGLQVPNQAGADAVPDIRLPQPKLSTVDALNETGGLVQTSPDNLTLYNGRVALRLLGGRNPHDEVIGRSGSSVNSLSYWTVEASIGGAWVLLVPGTSSFASLGTNSTGAYVTRRMHVETGTYSGILDVTYKAISTGPIKWDLEFTPTRSAHYRLAYVWGNVTSNSKLLRDARQFVVDYGSDDYTVSWTDVPDELNVTTELVRDKFSLWIDLGNLSPGISVRVDPSVVDTSTSSLATGYTFQRRVFYDAKGGNYWVFYYDGSVERYKYSPDGMKWYPQSPSSGSIIPYIGSFNKPEATVPGIFFLGQIVLVAGGYDTSGIVQQYANQSATFGLVIGTVNGASISWQPPSTWLQLPYQHACMWPSGCSWSEGIRDVNVAWVPSSTPGQSDAAFSLNWYFQSAPYGNNPQPCNSNTYNNQNSFYWSESFLFVGYKDKLSLVDGYYTNGGCYRYDLNDNFRSVVLSAGPSGGVRAVFQYPVEELSCLGQASTNGTEICSVDFDNTGNVIAGSKYIVEQSAVGDGEFSAVSDANYGTHLAYRMPDGTVSYAYRPQSGSWPQPSRNLFGQPATYPTLTIDYSTNDVYAFAIFTGILSVGMKTKTLLQDWSDRSSWSLVSKDADGPANLGSNFASWRDTNAGEISVIWTEQVPSQPGQYQVEYLSFPIHSVWSPFAAPDDPWDGTGIVPYGEYFSNLGEQVSVSTGLLTVRQTDLTVPGRGLDLNIARVYAEPYSFANSNAFNSEIYPWAPMGEGWQLSFPWLSNAHAPLYLHLSNGQGYRIPTSFWTGFTAAWENKQGDQFRLTRRIDNSMVLYDRQGVSYSFDQNQELKTIIDSTGSNSLSFAYVNGRISTITDTVGRNFLFCYSSNFLRSINQTTGTCSGNAGSVRGLVFGNNGQELSIVTDSAGRVTGYQYVNGLISQITYPTGWYTSYSYTSFPLGTGDFTALYRVASQTVYSSSGAPVRAYHYAYIQGLGDQIAASSVATLNGTQTVGHTDYSFTFAGMVRNASDANYRLVSGVQRLFGVQGNPVREIVLVTDGNGKVTGSSTNYYGYDKWGNPIYSRKAISAGRSHETYNSYYNDGSPPGFYAFQDTFSQAQGTVPDNTWTTLNGIWAAKNGAYNGTEAGGSQEDVLAWSSVGKADISLQARAYINRQVNTTTGIWDRVGIFAHYNASSSKSYKWALVLVNTGSGTFLKLLDEWNQWLPSTSCTISTGVWYTFNMTVQGLNAWGSATAPGISCTVSGTFPSASPALSGAAFGLYAGGYSAFFDDVRATTVSPSLTTASFSNSFEPNGAPGPMGLNTWLVTTKPPSAGWNTTLNWLPAAGWDVASPVEDFLHGTAWNGPPPNYVHNWADNGAQWIWSTSGANVSASTDPVWFRRVFNLTTSTYLSIQVTVDDAFTLFVDGNLCTTGTNWIYVDTCYTGPLQTGLHLLGLSATNSGGPAGFLLTAKVNGQVLFHTDGVAGPIIQALAGVAELQNGNASVPLETYYSYNPWGEPSLEKRLYSASPQAIQWLTTTTTHDAHGNPTVTVDPRGNTTYYSYSNIYQAAYLTNKTEIVVGRQISNLYTYNFATGSMLTKTDPMGNITGYQYDILGRTTRIVYPQQLGYVNYTYNDKANHVDIVNENGWKVRQIYDGLARLAITDRFQGQSSYSNETYTYNSQNKVSTRRDALGNTYSYQYDVLGRIIATSQPDGNVTSEYYNDTAPWVRTTNQDGNYRCSFYDRFGHIISAVEYADANCNPLALAGNFFVTNYQYDEAGNLAATTTSGYNRMVNPGFETGDFSGWTPSATVQVTSNLLYVHSGSYAAMGGGCDPFTLQQDFPFPIPGSSIQSVQFWYSKYSDSYYGNHDSVQVVYSDRTFNQTSLPATGGPWILIHLSVDRTRQVTGIKIARAAVSCYNLSLDDFTDTTPETTFHTYDNLNRPIKTSYPDGTYESYSYDSNGNVVQKTDRSQVKTLYAYDSLNRLTIVTYCQQTPNSDVSAYDKNGNLLQLQSVSANLNYTYDSRNRMLGETYGIGFADTAPILPCPGSGGGGGGGGGGGEAFPMEHSSPWPMVARNLFKT